jgi:CheY-like chemotaxis protein
LSNGLEVCQHIRATVDAQLPILLLTADHNPDLADTARKAGITAHLSKPVDADHLLEQIRILLAAAVQSQNPPSPAPHE